MIKVNLAQVDYLELEGDLDKKVNVEHLELLDQVDLWDRWENLAKMVAEVTVGHQDPMDNQVNEVPLVPKEAKVAQVCLVAVDQMVLLETEAIVVKKAILVDLVLKEQLVPLAAKETRAQWVIRELVVLPVKRVNLESMVHRVLVVVMVCQDLRENVVSKVHVVPLVVVALSDILEKVASLVTVVHVVPLDPQVHLVHRVRQDPFSPCQAISVPEAASRLAVVVLLIRLVCQEL